jgi:hypothetical protein
VEEYEALRQREAGAAPDRRDSWCGSAGPSRRIVNIYHGSQTARLRASATCSSPAPAGAHARARVPGDRAGPHVQQRQSKRWRR